MFLRLMIFCAYLLSVASGNASQRPASSEVTFQRTANLVWLKVEVPGNSKPLNFLLDSGAGRTLIDLECARNLGIELGQGESVMGVGRPLQAFRVKSFRGFVAGLAVPANVLAVDLRGISTVAGRRIDGLLGADFLKNRVVKIDYAHNRLRFSAEAEPADAGEVLKLYPRNDTACVQMVVNGVPGLFRVDTGCSAALLWSRVVANSSPATKVTAGITAGSGSRTTASVQLGSASFPTVPTGIRPQRIFPGEDGLLGNGLLSNFVAIIDLPRHRLILARR